MYVSQMLRQLERDSLAGGQGFPERAPVLHVGNGFVERLLSGADTRQANDCPIEIERCHRGLERTTLGANQMIGRNSNVIEEDRSSLCQVSGRAWDRSTADPREVERDTKQANASSSRAIGSGEHRANIGISSECDRRLFAGDDPIRAVADRPGGDGCGVGTDAGLGQGETSQRLSANNGGHPPLADLGFGPIEEPSPNRLKLQKV